MTLHDRVTVEGTDPPVQIGHKVKRDQLGRLRVARTWTAQYCWAGRHRYVSLGTRNKAVAIRKAHEIAAAATRNRLGRTGQMAKKRTKSRV